MVFIGNVNCAVFKCDGFIGDDKNDGENTSEMLLMLNWALLISFLLGFRMPNSILPIYCQFGYFRFHIFDHEAWSQPLADYYSPKK